MSYLKALGVLRIVGEQAERKARGAWRAAQFVLSSALDESALVDFFLLRYRPSPIVVPWSGADFFGVDEQGDPGPFDKKKPSGTKIIEAFLAVHGERLERYRALIRQTLEIMRAEAISKKTTFDDKAVKSHFLASLRSQASDELVEWIDTAAAIESDRPSFNILLGSGGGSDGNTHFSDNFMQNLWDVLPEFASQRKGESKAESFLRSALFGDAVPDLTDRTGALFDSGAVGGPNADAGFDGSSILNPWNFILAMEGTICFAGAVTRRLNTLRGLAAFPFTVSLSAAGYGTAAAKEENQREIWMPVWERFATGGEVKLILSEGRAQLGSRAARTGSDFARAVVSFGVDSGIRSFVRYGFVKGRVGGENYNTAVPLGHFEVTERRDTRFLLEIDGWLDRYRKACHGENSPPRFVRALSRIERGILDFTRYGGSPRMQEILRALGAAERELAKGEKFRVTDKRTINPIGPLSPDWLEACHDGSAEFRLAAAIASVRGSADGKVRDLRCDIEPVYREGGRWLWESGSATWSPGSLARNLLWVLERRLLESARQNEKRPALSGRSWAWLSDISAFVWGLCDERSIDELLWGLVLVDREKEWPAPHRDASSGIPPLPRSYALLKLLFLATPLKVSEHGDSFTIAPEPEVLARLRAGDSRGACRRATRRLRASGLSPLLQDEEGLGRGIDPQRLGAALIIPVVQTRELARLVLRPDQEVEE